MKANVCPPPGVPNPTSREARPGAGVAFCRFASRGRLSSARSMLVVTPEGRGGCARRVRHGHGGASFTFGGRARSRCIARQVQCTGIVVVGVPPRCLAHPSCVLGGADSRGVVCGRGHGEERGHRTAPRSPLLTSTHRCSRAGQARVRQAGGSGASPPASNEFGGLLVEKRGGSFFWRPEKKNLLAPPAHRRAWARVLSSSSSECLVNQVFSLGGPQACAVCTAQPRCGRARTGGSPRPWARRFIGVGGRDLPPSPAASWRHGGGAQAGCVRARPQQCEPRRRPGRHRGAVA